MFPAIRVKVSGLDAKSCYMLMMDVVPLDNKRYRYTNVLQRVVKSTHLYLVRVALLALEWNQ